MSTWPASPSVYLSANDRWTRNVGTNDNWQHQNIDNKFHITFFSNGQIASYPGYPIILGHFDLSTDGDVLYPEHTDIEYTIQTDSGVPVHGKLHIEVKNVRLED